MSCTVVPRSPTTSAQTVPRPRGTRIWHSSPTCAEGPLASTRSPCTRCTTPVNLIGSMPSRAAVYLSKSPTPPSSLALGADRHELEDLLLDLVQLRGDAGVDLAEV